MKRFFSYWNISTMIIALIIIFAGFLIVGIVTSNITAAIISAILGVAGVIFSFLQWRHPQTPPQLSPTERRFLIGTILLTASGTFIGGFLALNKFHISIGFNNVVSPSSTLTPQPGSSATPIASQDQTTPTVEPTTPTTSSSSNGIAYDFEGSSTLWDSSWQNYNSFLSLGVTTDKAYTGKQSLQVSTRFLGNATTAYKQLPDQATKNVYTYTDAKVYFSQEAPQGYPAATTLNLLGKKITCHVFLPHWMLSGGIQKLQIQMFVKDRVGGKERNAYGKTILIAENNVDQWIPLSMTVGNYEGGKDVGFDPTQVGALGVLLTVLDGSTIAQTGLFYIDDCTIT